VDLTMRITLTMAVTEGLSFPKQPGVNCIRRK
jgi:hypothetical protein